MSLAPAGTGPLLPPMVTLQILGGRKWKIRPGDVLGALAKDLGFAGAMVGKISVNEFSTHVAVDRQFARDAPRRQAAEKWRPTSVPSRPACRDPFRCVG